MRLTYKERILNYLFNEELNGNKPVLNSFTAKSEFKYSYNQIRNNVMRIARYMSNENVLTRKKRGQYILTPRGRQIAEGLVGYLDLK